MRSKLLGVLCAVLSILASSAERVCAQSESGTVVPTTGASPSEGRSDTALVVQIDASHFDKLPPAVADTAYYAVLLAQSLAIQRFVENLVNRQGQPRTWDASLRRQFPQQRGLFVDYMLDAKSVNVGYVGGAAPGLASSWFVSEGADGLFHINIGSGDSRWHERMDSREMAALTRRFLPAHEQSPSAVAEDQVLQELRKSLPRLHLYRTYMVVLTLTKSQWAELLRMMKEGDDGRLSLRLDGAKGVLDIQVFLTSPQPLRERNRYVFAITPLQAGRADLIVWATHQRENAGPSSEHFIGVVPVDVGLDGPGWLRYLAAEWTRLATIPLAAAAIGWLFRRIANRLRRERPKPTIIIPRTATGPSLSLL
jgi:hypothetical protein